MFIFHLGFLWFQGFLRVNNHFQNNNLHCQFGLLILHDFRLLFNLQRKRNTTSISWCWPSTCSVWEKTQEHINANKKSEWITTSLAVTKTTTSHRWWVNIRDIRAAERMTKNGPNAVIPKTENHALSVISPQPIEMLSCSRVLRTALVKRSCLQLVYRSESSASSWETVRTIKNNNWPIIKGEASAQKTKLVKANYFKKRVVNTVPKWDLFPVI